MRRLKDMNQKEVFLVQEKKGGQKGKLERCKCNTTRETIEKGPQKGCSKKENAINDQGNNRLARV